VRLCMCMCVRACDRVYCLVLYLFSAIPSWQRCPKGAYVSHVCVCAYVCVRVCMRVCACVCACACVYVYVY
jgi:hypothetical protein